MWSAQNLHKHGRMPVDAPENLPRTESITVDSAPRQKPSAVAQCIDCLGAARRSLDAYVAAPGDAKGWDELCRALHTAASATAALPNAAADQVLRESLDELIARLSTAGVQVRLGSSATAALPQAKGWTGLVAQMLVRPSWAVGDLPEIARVPDWLARRYAQWLFAVPEAFAAEDQPDRYASHIQQQLANLVEGVERNPGALAVRQALEAYQSQSPWACLRVSSSGLRAHAELHARLIARLEKKNFTIPAPIATSREGRRMRVGFIVPEFDGSAAMHATLPLLMHLDPERFETLVYVIRATETRWEAAIRQSPSQVQVLPAELSEKATTISNDLLDVLVFCGELAGANDDLAKLATARLAPLQVATTAHQTCTTGFANIDLLIAGALTDAGATPTQFSERLGLVPGPARTFDFTTGARDQEIHPTRSDVGLPSDAPVFVTAADWLQITPEVCNEWMQLLSAVPHSRLLFQRVGHTAVDPDAVARHCAAIDRALACAGLSDDRVSILTSAPSSHEELSAVLSLGTVYVDTQSSADDVAALAALSRGVPVVTTGGTLLRQRRVASLLSSIGIHDLVATTCDGFAELGRQLGSDSERRIAMAERIKHAMACAPWPLDGLATGDALGDAFEAAFDAKLAGETVAFRAGNMPLQTSDSSIVVDECLQMGLKALENGDALFAAEKAREVLRVHPTHAAARALFGRAVLDLGDATRAVEYLLPSVESADADASRWFHLARAFRQNGQASNAVQALQASLQLDASSGDSWVLLIELAEEIGANDLARDALVELRRHAPVHDGIEAISVRLGG